MNDLDNAQLKLMKAELKAYEKQLEIQRSGLANELKNGIGQQIKDEISKPIPRKNKFKLFINKLFRICK